eukprot:Opistho-1_new@108132
MGGIMNLPKDAQEKIRASNTVPPHMCCTDPTWLFRIYQDTYADVPAIVARAVDAISEASNHLPFNFQTARLFLPATVRGVTCASVSKHSITLTWQAPWNGQFLRNIEYQVYAAATNTAYATSATRLILDELAPDTQYDFWVRTGVAESSDSPQRLYGPFSPMVSCKTGPSPGLRDVLPPQPQGGVAKLKQMRAAAGPGRKDNMQP